MPQQIGIPSGTTCALINRKGLCTMTTTLDITSHYDTDTHPAPTAELGVADAAGDAKNAGDATALLAEQPSPEFLWVDPRDLVTTGNSRVVGDINETRPDLVASMSAHGFDPRVSVISVERRADGRLGVIVGYHRTAAAIAVIEHDDPDLSNPQLRVAVLVYPQGTRRDQLIRQGIENILRVGFSTAEEASYLCQLTLEGLELEEIAKHLGQQIEHVRAGVTVGTNQRTHAAAQCLPETDLVTLARLAEFADDPETHEHLVGIVADDPDDLDYEIVAARNTRQRRAVEATERSRFTEQGYVVLDDEYDLPEGAMLLAELVGAADHNPITHEEHAQCPGRAVHIDVDPDFTVKIHDICVDFASHDHRPATEVRREQQEQALHEQGVQLVDPDDEKISALWRLWADDSGRHILTEEAHRHCPGHAAYVTAARWGSGTTVTWVCADYAAHGHKLTTSSPAPAHDEPSADYLSAERQRAKVNNKAWKVAKIARREFLTAYFSGWRKRKANDKARPLPTRVQHWLGIGQVIGHDYLKDAAPSHRYACTLLGLDEPTSYKLAEHPITKLLRRKNTTEAQAIMVRLAIVIGAFEQHWDQAYTDNASSSWRGGREADAFYFELLSDALGYTLSPVERLPGNPEADIDTWPHLQKDAGHDEQHGGESTDGHAGAVRGDDPQDDSSDSLDQEPEGHNLTEQDDDVHDDLDSDLDDLDGPDEREDDIDPAVAEDAVEVLDDEDITAAAVI